jgi:nucleoside-diphosphate-sugar epimerase
MVTGSGGFIGRVLVRHLQDDGHHIIEFDREQGDISDAATLLPFAGKEIHHIFHLAGKTFVPESWRDPAGFYRVNVLGTVNILELCRKSGARLMYVSSYLYGEPEYLPVDENHPVKSYNPYSHSKLLAESACQFYANNYDLQVTMLRPFNAYGPGQSNLFLISEIIAKVMDPDIPVIEVSDLRPRRDYVYLGDVVHALLLSMQAPTGVYNIGSGYSTSVQEIIELVMQCTGIKKEYRSRNTIRPNEILDLFADIRKAKKDLGWYPKISFEEGIIKCIQDYNSNH